jgi:polysaccharide chain length determinant protein (PEP-CTERM system associated)
LKRELAGEEPILLPDTNAAGPSASGSPELDARIDVQKRQLDELLRRYTDQHPDVAQTRRMITALEEQKRQEAEARRKAAAAPARLSAATNPVFQQIKISLTEAEANVAALQARVAELQSRLDQLRAAANRVPQVEAELAQLNRDYDILRQNYQQMVARRESLLLTGELDETAGLAEFRIIEPPRVSDKPVFPNRMVMVPLLLVVAIGAGGGAAFVASQLMPTFHSTRSLHEIGQRPVLGSLSLRPTAAMVRRQRLSTVYFASSLAGLIGVYGAWLIWFALSARI